eukprot:2008389-Pyramimonas_sp.AAC.1
MQATCQLGCLRGSRIRAASSPPSFAGCLELPGPGSARPGGPTPEPPVCATYQLAEAERGPWPELPWLRRRPPRGLSEAPRPSWGRARLGPTTALQSRRGRSRGL